MIPHQVLWLAKLFKFQAGDLDRWVLPVPILREFFKPDGKVPMFSRGKRCFMFINGSFGLPQDDLPELINKSKCQFQKTQWPVVVIGDRDVQVSDSVP